MKIIVQNEACLQAMEALAAELNERTPYTAYVTRLERSMQGGVVWNTSTIDADIRVEPPAAEEPEDEGWETEAEPVPSAVTHYLDALAALAYSPGIAALDRA